MSTPRGGYYAYTWAQELKFGGSPRVSGKFLLDKGLWDGREVAVIAITRGHAYKRTERRIYYGTLDLSAGSTDQFGVRGRDGETRLIHKTRGVDVFDLSRKAARR